MAKKATKSDTSRSSSTSASTSSSTLKMQLRPRPRGVAKRSSITEDDDEKRVQLAKKPKTKSKKKKNLNLDPNKPKKPPTAFFYFLEDFRKEFQEKNPDIKSMRDVGKACGEKWKTMTYEEKVQYYDIATEKRAEFDSAMAEYIRRKESGEDQETEESEYDE